MEHIYHRGEQVPRAVHRLAVQQDANVVFVIRLLPFRPANFEPMLATLMPFGKRYGISW